MSLDISLQQMQMVDVHSQNITHNLAAMADEAGIYKHLWRPEEIGIETAEQLILPLRAAIIRMAADPARFIRHNAENGWGTYYQFLPWLRELLEACEENPDATVVSHR